MRLRRLILCMLIVATSLVGLSTASNALPATSNAEPETSCTGRTVSYFGECEFVTGGPTVKLTLTGAAVSFGSIQTGPCTGPLGPLAPYGYCAGVYYPFPASPYAYMQDQDGNILLWCTTRRCTKTTTTSLPSGTPLRCVAVSHLGAAVFGCESS